MKQSRRMPPRTGKSGQVQYFTFGPLEFNVTRAALLARTYKPQPRQPHAEMVGPNIEIDEEHVERSNLAEPVLFATLVMEGRRVELLIDGNHRVVKALRHGGTLKAVVLDLPDTLKVLSGPPGLILRMRADGERLGLMRKG